MASAQLLHLLPNPPLANAPDAGTQISATGTPDFGFWTTRLLDPAPAPTGSAQTVLGAPYTATLGATKHVVFGRYLTRPLPAQTIGAGNWAVYAVQRAASAFTATVTTWGFCVAQWRPSTGAVIARAVDAPTGGTALNLAGNLQDVARRTVQAGSQLVLAANDCLILELWDTEAMAGSGSTGANMQLLLNGLGQYVTGAYTVNTLLDTDAYLFAPAAITFT